MEMTSAQFIYPIPFPVLCTTENSLIENNLSFNPLHALPSRGDTSSTWYVLIVVLHVRAYTTSRSTIHPALRLAAL